MQRRVLKSSAVPYAHGPGEEGLARAEDYDAALEGLLEELGAGCRGLAGICVDATSFTMVPIGRDGRALEYNERLSGRPHARVKLWKRHTAAPQAEEALGLARELGEPFLGRTGGSVSCEWALPKVMELRDQDPEAYRETDLALDLCEYLTLRLTGRLARSTGSMSYKGLWAGDLGFPSGEYLEALRPGLGEEYPRLMRGPVLPPGSRAGELSLKWRSRLGQEGPVIVGAGVLDGHTSLAAMGAMEPGDGALVAGTSNVLTLQTRQLREIEGICGIAKDGLCPGLWGIDAGQSATGDMLSWFVKNLLPWEYWEQAQKRGISPHSLLTEKAREPFRCALTAADWWNGSRNAPCSLGLTGAITGLTLDSRPEELYLALLQAVVCGTGSILDLCEREGAPVKRLLICGGAAGKNRLLMEQYACLLDRPVQAAREEEVPALGAAVFAAAAAGIYPTVQMAWEHMGIRSFETFRPDAAHRREYKLIYERNQRLRRTLI